MASVRMAHVARGEKHVVSLMRDDHESTNQLEDGSLVQSVTVSLRNAHVQQIVVISYP